MKKKLGKIILVSILIATLSMFDFIVLGQNIAIAMEEQRNISTNIKNVEFDSYLNNEEATISSERFLNLEINVKEKGILSEGKIKIENANFTLQKDKVQNTYIKNINLETNEIELNTIVYGNHVKLEIPIQFNKKENLEADYFQKETTISLEGKYKNETEQKIDTKRNLKVNWTENTDIILNQEIKKYRVIPEIGVLLQQEITTEVVNNALPRENETLSIQVPILEQQPKEIYVIENGIRLSEEQVEYMPDANVVQIRNTNNLIWGKAKNNYQVIYLYDQEIEANNRIIEINATSHTKLFTKEEIQKTETKSVEISPIGNIVSLQKNATNELYKGYLYAKAEQETIYTENNTIQISSQEVTDQIEITKESEEFSDDTNVYSVKDQTIYKSTKVKKEEFDRILGEDGQITITDEANNVLSQITKETVAYEGGNIIINYETEINAPKITISKPVIEGEITISHTKAIKGEQVYNKEQLKTFTKLITKTRANEEIAEAQITLKDTKTEAKLEINNTNLSTLQTNENVQFLVTLKSDSIEYDLYKNPMVKIVLPAELLIQVKNITQLNAQDEINIVNPILYEGENKQKIIEMQLQGEQTHFENAINEGIQISITADISMEKTVPSKDTEITMLYTNENRPGEEFSKVVPIKLNSKYGVLMVNTIANYNNEGDKIENIDDKVKEAKLDIGGEAKTATQDITIINNYENEITDVAILGKIPTIGTEEINGEELRATFEMKLTEEIKAEKAQIYYSENPNEEKNSQNWTQTPEDFTKIKSFKLALQDNTLQPSEGLKLSYPLVIEENLEENEESYTNLEVTYIYLGDSIETNSTFSFKTNKKTKEDIGVKTKTEKLTMEVQGITGGEILTEGQEVYEGQGITYEMKITNHSQETLNHIKIKATNTNAIYYNEIPGHYQSGDGEVDEPTTRIEEDPELAAKEIIIEEMKAGETKEFRYQISVKEVTKDDQTTTGTIEITGDNLEQTTITTPTCFIKQAELKVKLESFYQEEIDILTKQTYPIVFHVQNISKVTVKDTILELEVPEELNFSTEGIFIDVDSKYEFVEYKDKVLRLKIDSIEANETIKIQVGLIAKSLPYDQLKVDTSLYFKAITQNKAYISNYIYRTIYQSETLIKAQQTANIQKDTIKDKDDLTFTFEIENQGNIEKSLYFSDEVPTGLVVQEAYLLDGETRTDLLMAANSVSARIEMQANQKIVIKIHTIVDTEIIYQNTVTNYAEIIGSTINVKTNEITYKVEGKEQLKPEDPTEQNKQSISGLVWVDENQNGLKDIAEPRLNNIPVLLLEESTGEVKETTITNQSGMYEFTNLSKGNYLVVFQYDATRYSVTEYQKEGINQDGNSDVITKTINLNNQSIQVAITKTLTIQETNLVNIDAGLVKKEEFDLRLDKYIDKIIIQNNKGTTVKQYGKEKLAKVELDSKTIQNSMIIIEYKIEVTNEGKISGYANDIVDYKPEDLLFNSEMNKNWYQSTNGELHSNELSNQIIEPTESKTVTLTLIKKMTSNNTGTIINMAEIAKASNSIALQDIDSTPGNKVQGEDDISTAEIIVSIRTGGIMMYFSLVFMIIVMIGGGAYLIIKKIVRTKEFEEKF